MAAAIVVVSRDMEKALSDLGAPAPKIVCNPCGVDTRMFAGASPEKAPPRFISVGRFVPKKGPDLTLRAFEKVVHRHPGARLVMIGDGPLLERCRALAASAGIGHAVTFEGVCPPSQVAAAMRGCRALVQHSLRPPDGDSEGTPVSILEAGASGLPVVATRHGGIKDVIIHGQTGLLVDEGDVDGTARHLMTLIDSPERAAELGVRARTRVAAHHSMEASIGSLMSVIEGAIANGRRGVVTRD